MKMFPEKIRELSKRPSSLVEWWKRGGWKRTRRTYQYVVSQLHHIL
jgi:hypothetical protein